MHKTFLLLANFCLFCSSPCLAHNAFVYVSNYGDGTISQFRANPNGTLTPLNPPTVKAYPRCHSMAVAQGRFLYALSALEFSYHDCLVSQFSIGVDGRLTPLSPATAPVSSIGSGPSLIMINPSGQTAYVMGRGCDTTFHINSDGRLTPMTPIRTANEGITGPDVHVTFYPAQPLLYESTQGHAMGPDTMTFGGVYVIPFQPDGLLGNKPLQMLDMSGDTPMGVFLAKQGRYAYVPHNWRIIPNISQYRVMGNGKLIPLKPTRVALSEEADIPVALVEPDSRFFDFVVRDREFGYRYPTEHNHFVRFAIGSNGMLRQRRRQALPVRGHIADALFDPTGRFLYLLTGNGIRPFRVRPDGSVISITPRSIHAGRDPLSLVYVQK